MSTDGPPYPVFVYSASHLVVLLHRPHQYRHGNDQPQPVDYTKVYFGRRSAISYVFAAIFDLLVASLTLFGLMLFYRTPLTLNAAYAILVVLVAVTFVTGLGLVLSAAQVRYRDIGLAMPLLLQCWMFATPVVYPLTAVPSKYRALYDLNPMVGVVENFRRVIVLGAPPEVSLRLPEGELVACILLVLAYIYFKNREATMADII